MIEIKVYMTDRTSYTLTYPNRQEFLRDLRDSLVIGKAETFLITKHIVRFEEL
jgi:hypothetical protein